MASMRLQSVPGRYGAALGIIRIMVGVVFLMHGSQKLFTYQISGVAGSFEQMGIPFPALSAVLATAAEFVGGLLLIMGLFTRLAAIPMAFTMLVAILTAHWGKGFFAGSGGYEYALLLMVILGAFAFAGGGAFAVDNLIRRKQRAQIGERHPIAA